MNSVQQGIKKNEKTTTAADDRPRTKATRKKKRQQFGQQDSSNLGERLLNPSWIRKIIKYFSNFFANFSKIFLKYFRSFRPFENFSKNRSRRDDSFGPKIVKIRAILAIFRPFKDFYLDFGGGGRGGLIITSLGYVIFYGDLERHLQRHFREVFAQFFRENCPKDFLGMKFFIAAIDFVKFSSKSELSLRFFSRFKFFALFAAQPL